jgi:hypothetical protein
VGNAPPSRGVLTPVRAADEQRIVHLPDRFSKNRKNRKNGEKR